ncbi:MAG: transposase [Thermoguttaceae bacterium]
MRTFDRKTGKPVFRKTRHRFDEPGNVHELTFSCYRGYQFLGRDRTRLWLLEELESARRRRLFELWAYVLMPEHVHLLIRLCDPASDVGHVFGDIKEAVARRAITYLETNSPHWLSRITVREGQRIRRRFWQPGGGYDRNVVELSTVHQMVEYLHANPVRRGLATSPNEWE